MSVPIILALIGTALMAVAIFVPFRSAFSDRSDNASAGEPRPSTSSGQPSWPELVEPSAAHCDADARLDIVDALASLRSPWAFGILHQAGADETDPDVRAAIASALSSSASSQSLVT